MAVQPLDALGVAISTALMLACATSAQAESMDTPSGLEEIVVTAQKRADNINDVPLSIATASGAELLKRGIADPTQLESLVPGFSYQKSSYGVPVFSLRGVGFYDTTQGVTPAVAVYVDEIPLPYSAMTRGAALDVERVEVLKGPQGTLFGQNSTGGAINYIAAKPTDRSCVRHVSRLRHDSTRSTSRASSPARSPTLSVHGPRCVSKMPAPGNTATRGTPASVSGNMELAA